MATVHRPATIDRAGHGFSLFFPDLPSCTSAGDTLQDVALSAEEALDGHPAVSIEHGDAISDSNDFDANECDLEVDEVGLILVRGERPAHVARVQVSIDDALLARIDRVAPNLSRFLADAARAMLAAQSAA